MVSLEKLTGLKRILKVVFFIASRFGIWNLEECPLDPNDKMAMMYQF